MTVRARTTLMPWVEIDMERVEYDDLLRQGLIVIDEPAPVADVAPAVNGTVAPVAPVEDTPASKARPRK